MAGNPSVASEELTTRQKIAVMQAFCSGKVIEWRTSRQGLTQYIGGPKHWEQWTHREEPNWDWARFEYRVKE